MDSVFVENFRLKYIDIEAGIRSELYCRYCNKQMLAISPFETKYTAARNMLQSINEYADSLLIHLMECEKYQEKL